MGGEADIDVPRDTEDSSVSPEHLLQRARLIWAAVAFGPILYVAVVTFLASRGTEDLLAWRGFVGPPVPMGGLLAAAIGAVVAPVVIVAARAFIDRRLNEVPQEQDVCVSVANGWMQRQLVFLMIADLPCTGALFYTIMWGTVPLLWVVAAETVLLMLFYLPRRADLEPNHF